MLYMYAYMYMYNNVLLYEFEVLLKTLAHELSGNARATEMAGQLWHGDGLGQDLLDLLRQDVLVLAA